MISTIEVDIPTESTASSTKEKTSLPTHILHALFCCSVNTNLGSPGIGPGSSMERWTRHSTQVPRVSAK